MDQAVGILATPSAHPLWAEFAAGHRCRHCKSNMVSPSARLRDLAPRHVRQDTRYCEVPPHLRMCRLERKYRLSGHSKQAVGTQRAEAACRLACAPCPLQAPKRT